MNTFRLIRIFFTVILISFISVSLLHAQQIVQVGVGEYFTTYRTDDGKLFTTKWGNSIPALYDFGLRDVIDVDGAQYTNVALTASGEVYVVGMNQTVNPYANLVERDNLGNVFLDNSKVYGFYGCYLSLRNGHVWYWGKNDILNKNGGADIIEPIELLQPADKIFVKLVTASPTTFNEFTSVWGLASDGTVWEWKRSQADPVQVDFPGMVAEDITSVAHFALLIRTSDDLFTKGYDPTYVGGISRWIIPGIQSVKSVWQNAGCVWPIKEMVGNYNTLHIIDANDNMWAAGSNPQGEIGNGIEFTPWRTASSPWQWDFGLAQLLTPPVQVPGKFKNICTGNTIAFYLYAQDMGNNWYSWGRNKSLSLGNGTTLSINNYAIYSEALNVPAPTLVTPLNQTWTVVPFNPWVQPPPFAHAGVNQYISNNETILYGSGSWQQDGTITNYHWTKISGTGGDILQPDSVNTTVTGLASGTYIFRMTVTNNLGVTASRDVTVVVTSQNQLPVVNAGTDQTIMLPLDSISMNGDANDPDGTIVNYVWNKISGPANGIITNPFAAVTMVNGLSEGVYKFQLSVTDNNGAIARDTMVVIVDPAPNVLPMANAGIDQMITLPVNNINLIGSGTDTDGTIVRYVWNKISGPNTGTLSNSFAAVTSVSGLTRGNYIFQLSVTDNRGAIARDTIMIIVNPAPNVVPVAHAGPDQTIALPVNSVILSGSGTDTDGTIVSFNWNKISGPAGAIITDSSSAITTVNGLSQGMYLFQLTVTDDSSTIARDTLVVNVNRMPNQLPIALAGADQTITLPLNTTTLTGIGSDADGTVISFAWSKISGPVNGMIANPSSAITTVTGLSQGSYLFELKVTDNEGAITSDSIFVLVLPAPNQLPTANAGIDQTVTLPNNVISLSGFGTDPDGNIVSYFWNKISGPSSGIITNSLMAGTTVSGLSQGVYKFQLSVTDNRGAIANDTVMVSVNAAPNQLPTANAGNDQTITHPNVISLTGTGTDPDGNIVSYSWNKISGPASGIISNYLMASTTVSGLSQGVYKFQLTVTDNNGGIAKDTVVVNVNAAPNQLPTANAGIDQTITLPNNVILLTGTGTDPDGNIVSYSWNKISGPSSGSITNSLMAGTTVTGLSQGIYKFQLTVSDNSGATARDTMWVTVNPAPNQLPFAYAGFDQTIALPLSMVTVTGSASDPDGSIISYLWTKITGPSQGNIVNPTSVSTTINSLEQGTYKIELKVIDNNGAVARDTMQIVVNGINLPPVVAAGSDQSFQLPVSSTTLSGTASDPDGSIVSLLWRKVAGPSGDIISSPNTVSTAVSVFTAGVYSYELKATDNNGFSSKDTVRIMVTAANLPPVVHAGSDQQILYPRSAVTLYGSATDNDGTVSACRWRLISGLPVIFSDVLNLTTSVSSLLVGSYKIELSATDNSGATTKDTVQITVIDQPASTYTPVAIAGDDVDIHLPANTITLAGTGVDPSNLSISYRWNVVGGPAGYVLNAANDPHARLSNLQSGMYVVELIVTNSLGFSGRDTTKILVEEPIVTNSVLTIQVYPNPVSEILTLEIPAMIAPEKAFVMVYDEKGSIVCKNEIQIGNSVTKSRIAVNKLKPGMYFVKVITANRKSAFAKIIRL